MGFFSRLVNYISGINAANKPPQNFVFGCIISGTYTNWKTDPHPTILYLGNFQKNGNWYIHGIQLHADNASQNWLLNQINLVKSNGSVVNPYMFFMFIKRSAPNIIDNYYRTYHASMCDFKIVNPGFSNINEKYCYPISDSRDQFLNSLTKKKQIFNFNFNLTQLRNNITTVINSVKVW